MATEGLLQVIHSVSSSENNFFNIYVEGLDDQVFGLQADRLADVIQNISSLLSKASSRLLGLRLLNKFLDQCTDDVFNKTGNLWTSLALKACHAHMQPNESMLAYEALGKITTKSLQSADLTKSFASGHLSKVYESLNYVPAESVGSALRCVEICLRCYPASSGPSRKTIEKFLAKFQDSLDADIVAYNGKCLHLMQQVSGGEVRSSSHKTQWKNYQTQLVGSLHAVFNDMFASCNEIWDDNIVTDQLNMEKLVLSDEPVNRAAQLYIRCHNLVQYLIAALKEPFPAEKPLLSKMLLGIINRGLSVTLNLLHQNPITDNIALALLMPKVHIDLLYLLDAVVSILRAHVLPYYNLILGLLMDIMKSTSAAESHGKQKPFAVLRAKIYDSVSLWCKIQGGGSRCDSIAEYLINEILVDVTPEQNELTLQVCAGSGKHLSKKMKRQLHKAQNERSNISKNSVKTAKNSLSQRDDKNQLVCIAALRCLQELLLSVASFLKPTKIKLLQTVVVQICSQFYEFAGDMGYLYSSAQCRLEIYNVLYVMVSTPHHLSPPPMDLILSLLNNACCRDGNMRVRNQCARILQNLEKLVHPQKESLIFPIDAREIRNAFIMLGQERLLGDSTALNGVGDDSDEENELNEDVNNKDNGEEVDEGREEESLENIDEHDRGVINSTEDSVTQIVDISSDNDVEMLEQTNEDDVQIVEDKIHKDVEDTTHKVVDNGLEDNDDCQIVSPAADNDKTHLEENDNTNDQLNENPKSPDIVLRVEDCDSPLVQNVDEEADDDEPSTKKAKTNDREEIQNIEEIDEEKLLEDIAATFVDDLA
ncbi:proline-, glutamic acid- and leucine-rich protein 1-like [Musca vetustissima]|uniref:proline-, glutamic acid- and leucine-rich protein 1-like n=1 Tax=Musca vetustissima TaxID=27455 RepID=UPI002AB61E93|nr:proline-, glutamic acid- and leucine-rich protein 1-like [Musca vetustissima]